MRSLCLMIVWAVSACSIVSLARKCGTPLSIMAWNIQVLGLTKMSKPDVVDAIVKVSVCYSTTAPLYLLSMRVIYQLYIMIVMYQLYIMAVMYQFCIVAGLYQFCIMAVMSL